MVMLKWKTFEVSRLHAGIRDEKRYNFGFTFLAREQMKIISMFARNNKNTTYRVHILFFCPYSRHQKFSSGIGITVSFRASIRILRIITIALDREQWTIAREKLPPIGKLFLCHRVVASSSERMCRSKANPCSYTFQYEGIAARGNGETVTARFTKVRSPSRWSVSKHDR
jgi:hypothetical protein